MEKTEIKWELDTDFEYQTKALLKDEGIYIRSGLGFEPISMIAGSIAFVALARVIVNLYKDIKYKGLIIDTTKDPIEIREISSWSRREVLIISKNGSEMVSFGKEEDETKKIENILKLLKE